MAQIHLKTSKTDQFGQGVDVVMGRTGTDIYPVAALVQNLRMRGPAQGPFFVNSAGEVLVKSVVVSRIRNILQRQGIPAHKYAGHSFCIGAAITAALVGVEDSMIQTLGRWHSAAFLRYIQSSKSQLAGMSAQLTLQVLKNS